MSSQLIVVNIQYTIPVIFPKINTQSFILDNNDDEIYRELFSSNNMIVVITYIYKREKTLPPLIIFSFIDESVVASSCWLNFLGHNSELDVINVKQIHKQKMRFFPLFRSQILLNLVIHQHVDECLLKVIALLQRYKSNVVESLGAETRIERRNNDIVL